MSSPIIDEINRQNLKDDLPEMHIGDTMKVHVRIKEGEKERVQVYAGTLIARDGSSATETITVRRISHGVGVERVFPLHSPYLAKIEIIASTHVRRAKLYYLRDRVGKKTRLREKIR
ncbi:MAG: 50S ribosomal protein L19 [Kiritimatiellae bacterium]|nr:50S ribosomal protein L19 [Kiritimatiellia bacterium]